MAACRTSGWVGVGEARCRGVLWRNARVSGSGGHDGELQVGRVVAAGVDDVSSAVGGGVLTVAGHHRSQERAAADDEAELFAGVEGEPAREKFDLDVDDFTG